MICILFLRLHTNAQTRNNYLEFKTYKKLQSYFRNHQKNTPLVSAHRGGPTTNFPENCIPTFENTIKNHPAIIETDISITKDSVLVMMHDDKLERTTNGTGKLSDYTYTELQKFFLKDNEGNLTNYKIPTLDEVLAWGKNKVIYTLDVKRNVPYKKVVEAVKKNNAEHFCIIITYNANQAEEVTKMHPKVMISVSARGQEDVERLLSKGIKKENIIAFVGISIPPDDILQYFKSQNIPMVLGTMSNLDKSAIANGDNIYKEIFSKGIFVISSDRPENVSNQIKILKNTK
ncbi:hypothetical protein AD998_21840 [bacterium 336/3]|nr:hypothetical protein AD998_21840 [bacterium 336/3]